MKRFGDFFDLPQLRQPHEDTQLLKFQARPKKSLDRIKLF